MNSSPPRPQRPLPRVSLLLPLFAIILQARQTVGQKPDEVSMGTTIVAVRYGGGPWGSGGIVVGADTRTSVSGYVSNRYAAKLTFVLDRKLDSFIVPSPPSAGEVGPNTVKPTAAGSPAEIAPFGEASTCCICRSGSAADTQYLADAARTDLTSRQVIQGQMGTVSDAAHLLRNLMRDEPDLSASLLCAGYDHVRGGGVIYSIAPGGTLMEEPEWALGGSGSGYILGYIDANYPHGKAEEWTEEEAVEFVAKVCLLAMDRDGSSGGFVRMYVVNREGKRAIVRFPGDGNSIRDGGGGIRMPMNPAVLKGFAPPSASQ